MKSADNIKLEGTADTEEDRSIMQEDINDLEGCSSRNRMEFHRE